jgi:hypothetical protein
MPASKRILTTVLLATVAGLAAPAMKASAFGDAIFTDVALTLMATSFVRAPQFTLRRNPALTGFLALAFNYWRDLAVRRSSARAVACMCFERKERTEWRRVVLMTRRIAVNMEVPA